MERPFNEVILDDVYDELVDRYQYAAGCRPRPEPGPQPQQNRQQNRQPPTPRPPQPPKQRNTQQNAQNRQQKPLCPPKRNYSEMDFARCERPDGTFYGTDGVCRKGTPNEEREARVRRAVDALKATVSGGSKKGGDNLQEPAMAAKYASFYKAGKDTNYTPKGNTSEAEVKEVMRRLKEEVPAKEYAKIKQKLASKGTPSPAQKAEWSDKGGSAARGEAVLKSLMDNDFKTVMGEELSWNQGMQLDHKKAGSTGGKDEPSNWIWISSPTNQAKGGLEAAVSRRNLSPAETDRVIREGLVVKLKENAAMTSKQVADAKSAGSAKVAAKAQAVQAVKDNFPLMKPSQVASRLDGANGTDLKTIMQGSVNQDKNPTTGRKASYRMIKQDSRGGRGVYPRTEEMRSIMRMRWGQPLNSKDLGNIGSTLTYFGATTRQQRGEKLDELLGNFPPTTGLTAAQRAEIIG